METGGKVLMWEDNLPCLSTDRGYLDGIMFEELGLDHLVKRIKQSFGEFCDVRTGQNTQYDMVEAGMGAFSVFFTQSPSFLAHQEALKHRTGHSNAESLFGMEQIPSDNQIRSLLDSVAPSYVSGVFRDIYHRLDRAGVMKGYRSHAHCLLIAVDGTEYFSSQKIHCDQCSCLELSNGKINYFHSVLTPVIVQPGNERVIALEPEYITPQEGKEKQDCEIEAGKRWVDKYGDFYAKQGVTILGDDLFSRQPYCWKLKDKKLPSFWCASLIRIPLCTKRLISWLPTGSWVPIKSGVGMETMRKSTPIAMPTSCLCVATRRLSRSIGAN